MRGMELKKRALDRAECWTLARAEAEFNRRLGMVELRDTLRLPDPVLTALPRKTLAVYELWRQGHDVRSMYSRTTFWRYRRELLPLGVDIRNVQPHDECEQGEYLAGVPLASFLAGNGVDVPAWAVGTELLAA